MKYLITKAMCLFSNGYKKTLRFDSAICDNVDSFRADLRKSLDASLRILGITVTSIMLTYEEYDEQREGNRTDVSCIS